MTKDGDETRRPLTEKETFDVAREIIRHEDSLINNRVTWLLVLQGFLFNAFVGGVGVLEKFEGNAKVVVCIEFGLVLLAAVGISASLTARNVVNIAFCQATEVRKWWKETGLDENFPPLSGSLPSDGFYRLFSTGSMLFLLAGVWFLLAVLTLIGVI